LMQRAGVTTVDCMHGYTGEQNVRMTVRTASTINLAWSEDQADRMRKVGTNREVLGGFAPLHRAKAEPRGSRPRILIAPNYLNLPYSPQNQKYAHRFAALLAQGLPWLADRAEIRVRLHPLDDREIFRRRFAPNDPPAISETPRLAE